MTLSEIDTKITSIVNVDTTVYTVPQRLVDINIWLYQIQGMIFGSMDEVDFDDKNNSDYPEQTTPMVAGQRDYTVPNTEKVVSFKRVDVTYNGVDWYRADPIDDAEIMAGIGPASATAQSLKVDQLFAKTSPRWDMAYNSVRIFPAASQSDVNSGAKIFMKWLREFTAFTTADYSAGTKSPGFDTEFHAMLAYGAAYEFFLATGQNQDAATASATLEKLETRLIQAYSKKELDRTMELVPVYNNFK